MTQQLAYASTNGRQNRSRIIRKLVYICIATAAAACVIVCLTRLPARLGDILAQRPLVDYRLPANSVVYSDKPAKGGHGDVFNPEISNKPLEWSKFDSKWMDFSFSDGATLFLHELKSPAGKKRIVHICSSGFRRSGSIFICSILVIKPGSIFSRPVLLKDQWGGFGLPGPNPQTHALTIFAGQPDPKDPRHFTIAYECGGTPGIIDGWLEADDSVKLEPRQ